LEKVKIGLVLWALVYIDWSPSPVLADRLKQAYYSYRAWKIEKIIVSGDNWTKGYNEPIGMQNYLVSLWVKKDDIYIDYAWFDTYDSIYRAKEIFWAEEIMIFTQDFHLNRSVYIWNRIWIKTTWIRTDLREYYYINNMRIREVLSRVKAFFDVEILKSKPKFLWEKIDMYKVQKKVE
jgi:SanA protein